MKIPGLIDLQINGYKGVDFSSVELDEAGFVQTCEEILATGTTGFLATLITSSREVYRKNLGLISKVMDGRTFEGKLLGVHLEGPFISPADGARGAHCAGHVWPADVDYLKQLLEWGGGHVRMLTVAAEIAGIDKLIEYAGGQGLAVSLGHQLGGIDNTDHARAAGAIALTHLGNGIPMQVGRHDNAIWAGLADDELCAMIITDGHHLPASLIKTFIRAKGVERIAVVSDASPIAGLPPGRYETLGNVAVLADDGRLYNPNTGYMVGSSATMLDCMNYLASLDLLSADDLVKAGFYNPLRLIGLDASAVSGADSVMYDEQQQRFRLT